MATIYADNKTKTLTPSSDNILSPGTLGGRVRVLTDTITLAGAAIDTIVQIGQDLKAGAIILGIDLQWAALGAATTLDVGDGDDDNRFISAEATNAAGRQNQILLAGLHYKIGTNDDDETLIVTLEGGVGTGQLNITVYYTED